MQGFEVTFVSSDEVGIFRDCDVLVSHYKKIISYVNHEFEKERSINTLTCFKQGMSSNSNQPHHLQYPYFKYGNHVQVPK
jgi:hypothetical protein